MATLLEKAIRIAVEAHAGQVDKAGRPYILHPLTLMMQMESDEARIVAVLHDVIEDTDVTAADLAAAGFPDAVLAALALLTHRKGVPYEEYIQQIKRDPLATQVKLADLAHNLDIRRLTAVTAKDRARCAQYIRARKLLLTP
jgi:guanosine-3',5'-bis(diphosphate) 3'-pyrophosphohydrolase